MITLEEILKDLKISFNNHHPIEPINKDLLKLEALMNLNQNKEEQAIINLTESHSLGLRWKAIYRQDKLLPSEKFLSFKCYPSTDKNFENLMDCLKDMPKEWTLIQMTSEYNEMKYLNWEQKFTDKIHITVFDCGQNVDKPFIKTTMKPNMELAEQLCTLIKKNSAFLKNGLQKHETMEMYKEKKLALEYEMKEIVTQIEYKWLAECRCLLTGKFCDKVIEEKIKNKIKQVFENNNCDLKAEMYLVQKIALANSDLNIKEFKSIIKSVIKEVKLEKAICKVILAIRDEYSILMKDLKRYPVILILDETLDPFPWEMMNVFRSHPVSRMPSLHLTYALFKQHKESIHNGMKQIQDCKVGKYIVNPGKDLEKMEKRLKSFFKYWLPDWEGISGQKPTSEEFTKLLLACQIFIYNGHGSGVQYIGYTSVEQLRFEAVVLLFGCSSIGLQSAGPNLECFSSSYEYLIACSPCIVGMLWDVSDFSTDMLTATFLTTWITSQAAIESNWNQIDYNKWDTDGEITVSTKKVTAKQIHEPELLRALSQCRLIDNRYNYIVKAACVARGIPTCLKTLS